MQKTRHQKSHASVPSIRKKSSREWNNELRLTFLNHVAGQLVVILHGHRFTLALEGVGVQLEGIMELQCPVSLHLTVEILLNLDPSSPIGQERLNGIQ